MDFLSLFPNKWTEMYGAGVGSIIKADRAVILVYLSTGNNTGTQFQFRYSISVRIWRK